ncbi:MAG: DsrE/DsrF/DrsH-like family protein [Actinobacteria bacterium]|nr:DsrE/DsrF/DrsH-like family protein [Actinomycetota bacterium]
MEDDTLSLVLFSGTDDKLGAAAILATGAAAMGRRVNLFLQYWALDAFRADRIRKDHGVSPEAGVEGQEAMRRLAERDGAQHWSDILWQAKDIGEVDIQACALSLELFEITKDDLDPLVDGVQGVAAFMAAATGPVVFI